MGHAYLQNWTGQCLSLFHPRWLSHYDALNKTRRDAKLMVSVADTKTCPDICPRYCFQWQFIFVNYYTLSGIPCLSMNTRICVILYCSYCILNIYYTPVQFTSVAQSCPTLCDPMDHSTPALPCPSPTPRVYSNSSPLSPWCHPTISSSEIRMRRVVPFSSCL